MKSNRYWNSVCHLRLTKESWNSQSVDMVQSVVKCSYTLHNCTNSIGNSSRSASFCHVFKHYLHLLLLSFEIEANESHWQFIFWFRFWPTTSIGSSKQCIGSAVEAVDFQNICYILTRKRNFNLINYMMFIWLRNISSTHWFTRVARFSFDWTWLHVWNKKKNTRIRQPSGIN